MTAVDWKATQAKVGADPDGRPGRETYGKLFAFAANGKPSSGAVFTRLGDAATAFFGEYGAANNRERIIATIVETCHETGGYTRFEENLNYSAQGLANTWPGRYAVNPTAKVKVPNAKALKLNRRPEDIANDTYALRMGNQAGANDNDTHPDGWQYRGRGPTMATGKGLYLEIQEALGIPLVERPDMAADPYTGLEIALWFYRKKGVFARADAHDDEGERRAVNGGLIGFAEVQAIRKRMQGVVIAA